MKTLVHLLCQAGIASLAFGTVVSPDALDCLQGNELKVACQVCATERRHSVTHHLHGWHPGGPKQAGSAPAAPGAALPQPEQPRWRADAEYSGKLRVLEWGGLSRTSAQWAPRWATLHRGTLYLLPAQASSAAPATHNIWTNRCAQGLPPFPKDTRTAAVVDIWKVTLQHMLVTGMLIREAGRHACSRQVTYI